MLARLLGSDQPLIHVPTIPLSYLQSLLRPLLQFSVFVESNLCLNKLEDSY